ncbi:MAG: GntR family transcriptional regulator [Oscillospiraceae bacterium]
MFSIDLRERTPIYEQLYKKITELVIKGELKQDDKLPSVRELAKELGVNPNTVAKAFQMLERDKVIYSLQGRGSFIAAVQTDSLKERALSGFDLAVNEALKAGLSADELIRHIKELDNEKNEQK